MPRDAKQSKVRRPVIPQGKMVLWHIPFAALVIIGMFYLLTSNNRQDFVIHKQEQEITKLKKSIATNSDDFSDWGEKQGNVVVSYVNGKPFYVAYVDPKFSYDYTLFSGINYHTYAGWYLTPTKQQAYVFKWDDKDLAKQMEKHFYGILENIKDGK